MERILVENSSNIISAGYDEVNHILEIEFKGGGVYKYLDVPLDVFDSFMNSGSKGGFFHQGIRNVYGSTKSE